MRLEEWVEAHVRFRYSLSDVRLLTISRRAKTATAPFAESVPELPEPTDFPPGSDLYHVRNVPLSTEVPRITIANGWIRYAVNQSRCYYADLTTTFETYLESLSGKTRSTLKRKVKKFPARNGAIDFRMYSKPDEMIEYHRFAREVAEHSYQEKLFGGGLPASQEFRDQMLLLAKQQRVLGFLLFLDGKPVSYLYLPESDGVLEYAFLGYDQEFSSLSPGTVLLYLAMEEVFRQGRFRQFSFGYGMNQTKEVFCTSNYLRADFYYARMTPKNTALIYSHLAMDSFSAACGRLLDQLGLRQRIKKFLRSR